MESEIEIALPTVSCLCPTYRRPAMLENAIALFEQQSYPAVLRELLILEDAGEIPNQAGDGWRLISAKERFYCLGDKYNTLAGLTDGDLVMVWEDDDVYLPSHIENYAVAWMKAGKPELAWFIIGNPQAWNGSEIRSEPHWFQHGSIAMTRALWKLCGGWPITRARSFDQKLADRLEKNGQRITPREDTYVFRWETTKHYHGQGWMHPTDMEDGEWWTRVPERTSPQPRRKIVPKLDDDTQRLLQQIESRLCTSPVP